MPDLDSLVTLQEAARLVRLSERGYLDNISRGKLPGFKVGGVWRIRREDLALVLLGKWNNTNAAGTGPGAAGNGA